MTDTGVRSCSVEWQGSRRMGADPVVYCVQLARLRHQEYKQVSLCLIITYVIDKCQITSVYVHACVLFCG